MWQAKAEVIVIHYSNSQCNEWINAELPGCFFSVIWKASAALSHLGQFTSKAFLKSRSPFKQPLQIWLSRKLASWRIFLTSLWSEEPFCSESGFSYKVMDGIFLRPRLSCALAGPTWFLIPRCSSPQRSREESCRVVCLSVWSESFMGQEEF